MAVGSLIIIKSEAIFNFCGRIGFFEKYLGTEGGSRLGYKLIGLIAFFVGLLIMTDLIGGFLSWVLSPIIRASR